MADFNTYQDQADKAVNSGNAAINAFNPTAQANSVRDTGTSLNNTQLGQIGNFQNAFSGQIAKQPQATDLYSKANAAFGVPQLAQRANYLNTQVTNALPTQQNLMRGFDASQEQVDNATNYNLRFLEPQATAATNASQTAQGLAGQYVQAGLAQNQMNIQPFLTAAPLIQGAQATQGTIWNTAANNELQGYIDKMNAGVTLSTQELQRATALAQAEEDYNAKVNAQKIASQNQIIGAGDTYYNPVTQAFYNPTSKVYKPA